MGTIRLGRRVVVYGPSGSGKTTVGRLLASRIGVPFVELDAIFHARPNWEDLTTHDFRREVSACLARHADGWVFDGNYGAVRDLVLPHADSVVWLRLPFPVVYAQLLSRTLRRAWVRAELWNGNRETFRQAFLSRDSILLWGLTAWRPHHQAAKHALATMPHGPVYELRSRRAVKVFLDTIGAGAD